jgi:antitoxin component of MazEF toxin-antitoxin module
LVRKVFKTRNTTIVSLPRELLEYLGLEEGMEFSVDLDREKHQIVITPVEKTPAIVGVDEIFTRQVAEFIEQYRPALEALARK